MKLGQTKTQRGRHGNAARAKCLKILAEKKRPAGFKKGTSEKREQGKQLQATETVVDGNQLSRHPGELTRGGEG